MTLSGEVDYDIDIVVGDDVVDHISRGDASLDELKVWALPDRGQVQQRGAILETIEADELHIRVLLHE
jgi:hypothetical protein